MSIESAAGRYVDGSLAVAVAQRVQRAAALLWPLLGCLTGQGLGIGLAIFAFLSISDRTQVITVALLGLVYVSIRGGMLAHGVAMRRLTTAFERELLAMKQAISAGVASDPATELERRHTVGVHNRRLRLEQAGLAVIALICLYHLADAVFWGMAYAQVFELR